MANGGLGRGWVVAETFYRRCPSTLVVLWGFASPGTVLPPGSQGRRPVSWKGKEMIHLLVFIATEQSSGDPPLLCPCNLQSGEWCHDCRLLVEQVESMFLQLCALPFYIAKSEPLQLGQNSQQEPHQPKHSAIRYIGTWNHKMVYDSKPWLLLESFIGPGYAPEQVACKEKDWNMMESQLC